MREHTEIDSVPDPARRFGRRAALATGGVAAGLALLRPSQASAATGNLQYGTANDAGADATELTSTTAFFTLSVRNTGIGSSLRCTTTAGNGSTVYVNNGSGGGTGVWIDAEGRGLNVQSFNGAAPAAEVTQQGTTGSALLVSGANLLNTDPVVEISAAGLGSYLYVNNAIPANTSSVVDVRQAGTGRALDVLCTNAGASTPLAYIQTNGTGRVFTAYLNNTGSTQPAAKLQTNGTGVGVEAVSKNGRGGRFAGKLAQLQLAPANTATHPTSGSAGDLYVDRSKRLWFCKGGTRWVQIA